MSRVVHFSIGADDPERAVKFYSGVFGWEIERSGKSNYWACRTGEGDGINGGITERINKQHAIQNTISVESAKEFCERIAKYGGKVISDPLPYEGVGYVAYCQDTEGNLFSIVEPLEKLEVDPRVIEKLSSSDLFGSLYEGGPAPRFKDSIVG